MPVAPTLSLAVDTGRSGQDHITSSGTVNVSGLEPGATLAFSLDDGKTWTSHGGDAQLPETLLGADGAKHLEVRQIDVNGNAGEVADLSFTLDRTAPDALHWSMPTDKAALGVADTMAVQGIETDALVQYRPDASMPWLVAAGGLVPVSMFQHDGVGQVEVRQVDVAGNPSDATTLVAHVDVTAPAAPTLSIADDTGFDPHDRVTAAGAVTVQGLEPTASLALSLDGGKTWTPYGAVAQLPDSLFGADGDKHLMVKQIDASGNPGDAADLSFTLDRTAPGAPTGSMPTGKSALGLADAVAVQGVEDGAQLAYRIDGKEWTPLDTHQLSASVFNSDGAHTLELRQTDLAGNPGAVAEIPLTVDLTPPQISAIAVSLDTEYPGNWREASRPTSAHFFLDYRVNGGEWKSPGSLDLSQEGHYRLEVRDTDAAGNQSILAREVTIDNTPPAKLGLELINDNGASSSDKISGDLNLRVVGLEPDATWTFANGISHFADIGSGDTIPMSALGLDPSGGQQLSRVSVQQQDQAGNFGPGTVVDFTYDPSLGTGVFHV